jgi:hypothetical protein
MMGLGLIYLFIFLTTYFVHEMYAIGDDIEKHGRNKR